MLSIALAKARFAETVRRAEMGETVVLTRHGRPVAQLAPLGAAGDEGPVPAAAGEIHETDARYRVGRPPRSAPADSGQRRRALERLLEESIWPRVPPDQRGAGPGKSEREKILGYGSEGV